MSYTTHAVTADRTTGCITDVPQSQYSKGVFGFDGQLLLGMDVTQVVDAFQLWETSNGPGTSVILLETLANRCAAYVLQPL